MAAAKLASAAWRMRHRRMKWRKMAEMQYQSNISKARREYQRSSEHIISSITWQHIMRSKAAWRKHINGASKRSEA